MSEHLIGVSENVITTDGRGAPKPQKTPSESCFSVCHQREHGLTDLHLQCHEHT